MKENAQKGGTVIGAYKADGSGRRSRAGQDRRAGLAVYLRSLLSHVLKRFDDDYEKMTKCAAVPLGGGMG